MIYAVLGKSASGKTTIVNEVKNLTGIKSIVTTTTRPKRQKEVDGVDYHFVSDEEFNKLVEDKKMIAIFVAENNWKYGINLDNFNIAESNLVVIEPRGYDDLMTKFGKENIFGIYIKVKDSERLYRLHKRGDDEKEMKRRFLTDQIDFENIELKVDKVIENTNFKNSIKSFLETIESREVK